MKIKWIGIFVFFVQTIAQGSLFLQSNEFMDVGKWTYGEPTILFPRHHFVRIGNFCSFAGGVLIIIQGEHRSDWISTYPFMSFASGYWPNAIGIQGHPGSKGPVVIGNDVWIGANALILSGVTIGDGAVIGAHAVISKDVPPYSIVAGNPGRVVKYRFNPETIDKLLAISWWNWSDPEIHSVVHLLCSEKIDDFIQYCEATGKLSY